MNRHTSYTLPLLCLCACFTLCACSEKPSPSPNSAPTNSTSTNNQTSDKPDATGAPAASDEPDATAAPKLGAPPDPPMPIRGGPCQYEDTLGVATITSIGDPRPDANVCPKPSQEVRFSFTPVGADAPTFTDRAITIGDGKALPTACLEPLGLKVGAVIPDVVLKQITSGACTPVAFSFTEGFLKPCADACF